MSARGHPLRKPALHVLIGTRDRFASEERIDDEQRRLTDAGLQARVERYTGGHGIAKDALVQLARSLGSPPNA